MANTAVSNVRPRLIHDRRGEAHPRPIPTREQIVRTAAGLFYERGYHATSLEEIAVHVGIRKASLFHYFTSKQELLREVFSGCIAPSYRAIAAIQASHDSPSEKLRKAVVQHVFGLLENVEAVGTFLREGRSLPRELLAEFMEYRRSYGRLFRLIIEEGQASGAFRPLDARHMELAVFGMLNWIPFWYRPDGRSSPEEIADSFAALALAAVGVSSTDAGREKLPHSQRYDCAAPTT